MGYFDPWKLSEKRTDLEVKKMREAEIKHGRVCMLASLGILVQEKFHPLFGGRITGAALYHFQQADNLLPNFWLYILVVIGSIEVVTISKGWESKVDMSTSMGRAGVAELKV